MKRVKKKFYIISHTHWDREWYQTYQKYRIRLVRMMDELIDVLEDDLGYSVFHLDGQTIPIDDYLEIRPYKKDRLHKLIEQGKIIIGPWYVMPDEFLVSGESLIRNLAKGINDAKKLNTEPMRNGYVVDCFGHNSQMPQILRGFSINEATLFRGIGDFSKDQFWWEGADKSRIRVFKLCKDRSYGNFYFSLRWPFESDLPDEREFKTRAEEMIERAGNSATGNSFLMMDGCDHVDIDPELCKTIDRLNRIFPDSEFVQSTIAEYTRAVCDENAPLEVISGPLYSVGIRGLNNRLLKNVLSSIVIVKQANDSCETELTQRSEPWDAIDCMLAIKDRKDIDKTVTDPADITPRSDFLKNAWNLLMQNHPHDSICGCSVSDVHRDNMYRYRQVKDIAESMTADAMSSIASRIEWNSGADADGAFVVFNNTQNNGNSIREIILPLPADTGTMFMLKDDRGNVIDHKVVSIYNENEPEVRFRHLIGFGTVQYTKVIMLLSVPAMGYTIFSYEKHESGNMQNHAYSMKEERSRLRRVEGSLKIAPDTIDNGVYRIRISPNGTLDITVASTGKKYSGILAYEDSGDCGDGWKYVKPVMDSTYISFSGNCDVSFQSDSVLGTVFTIKKTIGIPETLEDIRRSSKIVYIDVFSEVTVLKDNPRIDVKISLRNTASCHRLRVLFPTELDTGVFYTKTPFDMQKWSIGSEVVAESNEIDTHVVPSQGVTYLSDERDSLALYAKGAYELSVRDDIARTVALTLFRSHAVETTKLHRDLSDLSMDLEFEIAFDFTVSDPFDAWIASNDFRCPPNCFLLDRVNGVWNRNREKRSFMLKGSESFLQIDGNAVMSAFYRKPDSEDDFILRIVNPGETDSAVTIEFFTAVKSAFMTDFEENTLRLVDVVDGKIRTDIRSKEIQNIKLLFNK